MNGTTIVVCPASLLTNWEREIARFENAALGSGGPGGGHVVA